MVCGYFANTIPSFFCHRISCIERKCCIQVEGYVLPMTETRFVMSHNVWVSLFNKLGAIPKCRLCEQPVEVGQKAVSRTSMTNHRKHYHASCWDSDSQFPHVKPTDYSEFKERRKYHVAPRLESFSVSSGERL